MAIIEMLKRTAHPVVCLALLSASTFSFAAVTAPQTPQPQITQAVNNRQRITLHGNVRPMPRRARDLGAINVSMPASRVLLLLKRPAPQEAALQQFIAEAHTPGTASYHHWLTPAQLGAQYGPADSDVQAVVTWLQSQGFAVANVSPAKNTIEFSGTAGQIEHAFATQIHSFQLDGVEHISNVTDPQIPAALAPVIAGISPLNDFRPKPMHTVPQGRTASPAPTSADPKAMSITPRPGSGQPNLTVPNNGSNLYAVSPSDAATIYNTPNSTLNKNYAATKNLTGTGVNVGIAGDSNVDMTNVANYRNIFGLSPTLPTVVVDGNDPGTGSGDEVEALLDLEVVSALAPDATTTLYTAQDTTFQAGLSLAIQRALNDNKVDILNVSFGLCEAYEGQSGNVELFNLWQQAAAQGISVTVSTGDSGSAGCDNPNTEDSATQGLQVNAFASTPYNIAVGGTDFNQTPANEANYWSATNSAIGGSAKGPIPEIPWNDSTTHVGQLSGNVPFEGSQGNTNIGGAGGGVSSCLNASVDGQTGDVLSCPDSAQAPGFYRKPSWQSGFGTSSARQLPDVSLFAADGLHDSAWVLCASGLGADGPTDSDCVAASGGYQFQIVGGTSASSPAFAGVLALVIQKLENGAGDVRLGQANYTLYPLSKQHAAAFHDVTTGNNSVYCLAGATNCGSNGFLTGYNAATGYDLASGLGSVDATQLVQNWSNITFKASTTALTVNGSTTPISIQHGTSVKVGVIVTGSGGTPSGNVALVASGGTATMATAPSQYIVPSPSTLTLANGAATNNDYYYLPGGSYNLAANYAGDGTFGPSVSNPPIAVTVSPEPSTLILTVQDISTSNQGSNVTSLPYGIYVSVSAQPFSTAQLNSSQNYALQATGSVVFSSTPAFAPLNQSVPIDSNGTAEIPNQLSLAYPPGTYNLTATYPGDASFGKSSSTGGFIITKNNVSIASATDSSGNLLVQVAPNFDAAYQNLFTNGGMQLPSGTVTVKSSSGAVVGTGTLAVVNTSQGPAAQATITLTGAGATINYPGDTNYNPATVNGGGGVTGSFTLAAAPATLTISRGSSKPTTMSVTPKSGFIGAVNLSCAVSGGASAPTCSLATPSVTISGTTAATDVLTVQTASSSSATRTAANPSHATWYAAGGTALAGILLFGLPGRRRKWQSMLSLLLFIVAIGVVGCGGSSSGGGGTPTGNYTVTVTATSGSTTTTSTVTVTVQ